MSPLGDDVYVGLEIEASPVPSINGGGGCDDCGGDLF